MAELIAVKGTTIQKIEYNGQSIISLPMVDKVHRRPAGTAKRTFQKFRNRFLFEADYYDLPYEEWSPLVVRNASHQRGSASDHTGGHRGNMIFLTLTGYLMLVKPFSDDLSWTVQRILVESYFKATHTVEALKDEIIVLQRQIIQSLTKKTARKVTSADHARIRELAAYGLQTHEIKRQTGWSKTTIKTYQKMPLGFLVPVN